MISQFATISSGTGEGTYPEPAASFVRALAMSNLDILGFGEFVVVSCRLYLTIAVTHSSLQRTQKVPLGCIVRGSSFYHAVLFKTSAPVVIIVLLWCYPMSKSLRGQSSAAATRTVSRLVLLLLEVCLPNISTSLVQVFVCDIYEDKWFLRAQLSLPCNSSNRRIHWMIVAIIALVAYPVGGEFESFGNVG